MRSTKFFFFPRHKQATGIVFVLINDIGSRRNGGTFSVLAGKAGGLCLELAVGSIRQQGFAQTQKQDEQQYPPPPALRFFFLDGNG